MPEHPGSEVPPGDMVAVSGYDLLYPGSGAVLAELARGTALEDALALATHAAAVSVTRVGSATAPLRAGVAAPLRAGVAAPVLPGGGA